MYTKSICLSLITVASLVVVGNLLRGGDDNFGSEPSNIAVVGQKIDYWGKTYDFFYEKGVIRFAYLDLIRGKYVEGSLNVDEKLEDRWNVVRNRERRIDLSSRRRANSFLVFRNSSGIDEILVFTVGDFFYWGHRDTDWKDLSLLDRNLNVQPVRYQGSSIEGVSFFRTSPIGGEGKIEYYRMDFNSEKLTELEQDTQIWATIGEWDRNTVLGTYKQVGSGLKETGVLWRFHRFDADKSEVGEPVTPRVLFRDRVYHAQIVRTLELPTVIFGDKRGGGRGGLTVVRLLNERWEGRELEVSNGQRYLPEEVPSDTIGNNTPDFGNFEVEENGGRIYVSYILDGGVYLQVWDDRMEEFTEYWLGQFGEGTGKSIKMKVVDSERLFMLSKDDRRLMEVIARDSEGLYEVIDGDYIVDLKLREWKIGELSVVRNGRLEDLPFVDVTETERLEK